MENKYEIVKKQKKKPKHAENATRNSNTLKQGHRDNALWILALMAHKRSFEPCNMNKLALLTFAGSAREKAKAALTNMVPVKPVNFKCAPILPQSDFLALTFGLYWLDYLIDGLETW